MLVNIKKMQSFKLPVIQSSNQRVLWLNYDGEMKRKEDTLSIRLILQLLWLHSSDRKLPVRPVYERNLDLYNRVCFTRSFGNWWPEGGTSFWRILYEAWKGSEGNLRSPVKKDCILRWTSVPFEKNCVFCFLY